MLRTIWGAVIVMAANAIGCSLAAPAKAAADLRVNITRAECRCE